MQLKDISKSYASGPTAEKVLEKFNLQVNLGEVVAVTGPSGSGKSTLVNIMGLLDNADSGQILCEGKNIADFNFAERDRWRLNNIGFIYQSHHLLPELNICENVAVPLRIRGAKPKEANIKSAKLLADLGLERYINKFPSQLSGGEQQRAAVARAIITSPLFILADEPTGNLDKNNAHNVFKLLQKAAHQKNCCVIVVTHNNELANLADQNIIMAKF